MQTYENACIQVKLLTNRSSNPKIKLLLRKNTKIFLLKLTDATKNLRLRGGKTGTGWSKLPKNKVEQPFALAILTKE